MTPSDRTRRPLPGRVLVGTVIATALAVPLLLVGANVVVVARTSDAVAETVDEVRSAQVAIVPGSAVRPDGTLGRVVQQRVDAAVALHAAGGGRGDPGLGRQRHAGVQRARRDA